MFCKACAKIVSSGDELRDEKGCVHSHKYQLCSKCRPKDQMSEGEVSSHIQKKIKESKENSH